MAAWLRSVGAGAPEVWGKVLPTHELMQEDVEEDGCAVGSSARDNVDDDDDDDGDDNDDDDDDNGDDVEDQ